MSERISVALLRDQPIGSDPYTLVRTAHLLALVEAVEALADLNALPTERSFARADEALSKFDFGGRP